MYSVADYGAMIADRVRTDAFARALREAITPESVVLDIGTGTGVLALLACRFGARRVYAVEPSDVIEVAREIAAANGFSERLEFLQATSTAVELPEQADVIVSDLGGALPWFQNHIPAIVDARRRLLAPGGVLIPERDVAWAAVVDACDLYDRRTRPWTDNDFGLDMEAARRIVVNSYTRGQIAEDQLLTETVRWATLAYEVVDDPNLHARVSWTVTRAGTGHGIAAGFDRTLVGGIKLSDAPDAPEAERPRVYGTAFFPWLAPVELAVGDRVTVDLEAKLIGGDYVWSWKTRVVGGEGDGEDGAEKVSFAQSTFLGAPLSPATLRKQAASHTPTLTEDGRIARLVLDAMSRGVALGEIAGLVSAEFPARFPHPEDALGHVAKLSRQFSA
ncbi:MAG: 50S ribosomal protein L11 methyltransferase [Vicinamibacterales bacterium]|jgi:protein arginine N-methyltransferase 1|nr:50S ribosomal protein L11 methyltransferase [Vicinamibacterales bacterium]